MYGQDNPQGVQSGKARQKRGKEIRQKTQIG
jgi:hypothetical protein